MLLNSSCEALTLTHRYCFPTFQEVTITFSIIFYAMIPQAIKFSYSLCFYVVPLIGAYRGKQNQKCKSHYSHWYSSQREHLGLQFLFILQTYEIKFYMILHVFYQIRIGFRGATWLLSLNGCMKICPALIRISLAQLRKIFFSYHKLTNLDPWRREASSEHYRWFDNRLE